MSGTYASKLVGGAGTAVYYSEIQDWGLSVKDLLGDLVIRGRGTANVTVDIKILMGPEADVNVLQASVAVASFNGALAPWALPKLVPLTAVAGMAHPYFRVELTVGSSVAEDHAEIDLFLGGKTV